MRAALAAAVLAAALTAVTPSAAQTEGRPPEELAIEGIERLMQALEAFIHSIPQYEAPQINENGDIIIRRKRPPESEPEPAPTEPEFDETAT
ncbi:MAG: hypothetical protein WEC41_05515 [Dongiaceae bacterium]